MDLHEIAAQICAQMPLAKANKKRCAFNFSTTSEGLQYVYFTVFFEDTNKSFAFYEFHTQAQHTEKLDKIGQFLGSELTANQLHDSINLLNQ